MNPNDPPFPPHDGSGPDVNPATGDERETTCMICGEPDAPWDGSEYTHPECWALLDDPDWRMP